MSPQLVFPHERPSARGSWMRSGAEGHSRTHDQRSAGSPANRQRHAAFRGNVRRRSFLPEMHTPASKHRHLPWS